MRFLDNFRPSKLLEHGDGKLDQVRRLLYSVTNPHDQDRVRGWLQQAEYFKPYDGQPGMTLLGRLRQARRYLREADNALQNIESIIARSPNHQLPNGNAH